MPRKIGYGKFTPKRRAALQRAAIISARKRRKHGSEQRNRRKKRNKKLAYAAVGAAAAIGVGAALYGHQQNEKKEIGKIENRLSEERGESIARARESASRERMAARDANIARLRVASGDVFAPAESQEQLQARIDLYGDVMPEYSDIHEGRPEIFPTIPRAEIMETFQHEQWKKSYSLFDENKDEEFVTLFHRTGGGKDVDPEVAKASILKNQTLQILNRDEKRVGLAVNNELVWMSNKLNDSNTRGAFGETVVQIKVPRKLLKKHGDEQTFGKLSPIKESWMAINPKHLAGLTFEDVPPEMITPPPERKFRAAK